MATFMLRQGKRYRATISLGLVERLATNEFIAEKLHGTGFSDVRVSGGGAMRVAEVLWPGPDRVGEIPTQVTGVDEV
jgi:hypothetical protein